MPNCKAQLFLQSNIQGWSETYYFAVGNFNEQDISNFLFGGPGNVILSRIRMLPPDVGVIGIRVSQVPLTRSVLLFFPNTNYPTPTGAGVPGFNQFPSAGNFVYPPLIPPNEQISVEPEAAVKIRMVDASGTHRRIFLARGLPWQIIGTDGSYFPNGAPLGAPGVPGGPGTPQNINWPTALNNFLAALAGKVTGLNACQINFLTPNTVPPPGTSIPAANVLTVGFGLNNEFLQITTDVQIMTGPAFNIPVSAVYPNNTVIMRKLTGGYRVNGPWNVFSVKAPTPPATAWTYVLGPKRRNVAIPSNYSGGAKVIGLTYQQVGIASATIDGPYVVTRRTGRPFGLLVGRRAAR